MRGVGYRVSKNFENALKNAKGDYIFLADQDDIWMNSKVEVFMHEFKNGYDFLMSNLLVFTDENLKNSEKLFSKSPLSKSVTKNLLKDALFGCSMAFSKRVKDYVLPIPENVVSYDIWIGMIACKKFKYKFIKSPTIYYRRHSSNVSEILGQSTNPLWYKLFWRWQMLCSYAVKILKK